MSRQDTLSVVDEPQDSEVKAGREMEAFPSLL